MSSDANYDREGQFFPIFFVTVSSLVVIPITISVLRKSKELENTASRIDTEYRPKHADLVGQQLRQQKKAERKLKRILLAVGGWIFIALNIYWIVTIQRTAQEIWNPYEILNIGTGATEKQIQSRYRKLSVTLHPDKAKPDPAKNETEVTVNERWVEIIKAYKTLTDEDVRRNFELYGHPDGKQATTFGIALPQFLITEGNGKYVMIVYGALLGIVLPYFVGSWWYGSQKVTRDGTLVTSVGRLFKEWADRIDRHGVIRAICVGEEFNEVVKGTSSQTTQSIIEERILAPSTSTRVACGMTAKEQGKLQALELGPRRRAQALLWAYLGRVELGDESLENEKFQVATTAFGLGEAFMSIALAYGISGPVRSIYESLQNILQAIPPEAPPLMQLPHLNREMIVKIEEAAASSHRRHLNIQDFMDIAEARRREIALAAGLNTSQYLSAINVASQLPRLVVEHTFFKVTGEKHVVPNSLIQFVVKARFIPPGSVDVPKVDPADLEDSDDEDEQMNTKAKANAAAERSQHQPPLTHAPFFARNHAPRWHLFMSWMPPLQVPQQHPSQLFHKLAVPPHTFQTFNKPIMTSDGKPTYAMQTLKVQFAGPNDSGEVRFQMHLICDSYVGFDDHRTVVMEIKEPEEAAEIDSEDDPSEPEDDTIAGQMAALKGDATASTKKRAVKENDSDDDSATDEDDDASDTSETDTDTDED